MCPVKKKKKGRSSPENLCLALLLPPPSEREQERELATFEARVWPQHMACNARKSKVIVSVWSKYEFGCSITIREAQHALLLGKDFTSILLFVTDGRIAPTTAAATAIFPSTVAPYRSDAIRHNHCVVEGHLEYIGEAASAGAAACSAESSISVSRCVCACCLVLVFYGVREHNHNMFQVLTERVCSCCVLLADPVADEAYLRVFFMVDNEILH
ncbi:hypothetical protein VPH35_093717 [Triticum aestivum]